MQAATSHWCLKTIYWPPHPHEASFTYKAKLYFQYGEVVTSIIKCGIKSLIHSHTSTVTPSKFKNRYVISLPTLLCVWLLTHTGVKVNEHALRSQYNHWYILAQRLFLFLIRFQYFEMGIVDLCEWYILFETLTSHEYEYYFCRTCTDIAIDLPSIFGIILLILDQSYVSRRASVSTLMTLGE